MRFTFETPDEVLFLHIHVCRFLLSCCHRLPRSLCASTHWPWRAATKWTRRSCAMHTESERFVSGFKYSYMLVFFALSVGKTISEADDKTKIIVVLTGKCIFLVGFLTDSTRKFVSRKENGCLRMRAWKWKLRQRRRLITIVLFWWRRISEFECDEITNWE